MASTFSDLKIQLMATGENSGTWGDVTNVNLGTAIEEAITGSASVAFSSADVTLPFINTNETQAARNLRLNLTGTSGGARNLIVPAIEKVYIINNGLADTVTVKNAAGTGIAVPTGKTMYVYNNGTNVVDAITHLTSLTLGSALPVASGGTGITSLGTGVATFLGTPSSANLAAAVTDETGTGALVFANSPTLVTPALGTPASGVVTNLTGTASININGTVGASTPSTVASTNLSYTGTLTGGTGVINIGSGQVFKDAAGNVGLGTSLPPTKLTSYSTTSDYQIEVGFSDTFAWRMGRVAASGKFEFTGYNGGATPVVPMTFDLSGKVGIGTSSPTDKLEVVSAGSFAARIRTTTANTFLSFSDTGTTGLGPLIGSNGNSLLFGRGGVAEFARIDASGNLLVGRTSAANSTNTFFRSSGPIQTNESGSTTPQFQIVFTNPNGNVGTIVTDGTSTGYNTSSDYRLKEDAQPVPNPIERLMQLNPINFAWKIDGSRTDGFLAHEAQAVVPQAVTGTKDAVDKDGKPVHQGIDQSKLVPLLTAALQDAIKRIEQLELQINSGV